MVEKLIESALRILHKRKDRLFFKNKRCCVCGKKANSRHMSLMGSIPYYVCDYHHENTSPFMGYGEMGLLDKKGDPIELTHYKCNEDGREV